VSSTTPVTDARWWCTIAERCETKAWDSFYLRYTTIEIGQTQDGKINMCREQDENIDYEDGVLIIGQCQIEGKANNGDNTKDAEKILCRDKHLPGKYLNSPG
jgi:hypothetical protein